ncbi:MAG: 4Fe-4S dicluster domain-containing protein [Nitrospirae bacterium]|nr:4Fe-4S dicluster domain-containing protein [Nitrospirota bacterium]
MITMVDSDTMRIRDGDEGAVLVGQRSPTIDADRCLNLVHRDAGCRRCAVVCPVDAIDVVGTTPTLDVDRCVGCGVCVAVCPTDVFDAADRTEKRLALSVASLTPADLAVVCSRRDDPTTVPASMSSVAAHERCLASIDAGYLMRLANGGERPLILDDTLCETCPIGSLRSVIVDTVDTANALLGDANIELASSAPVSAGVPDVIDGSNPRLSRRGLFGMVAERVTEATGEIQDGALPASRVRLRAEIAEPGPLEAARVPMATVHVDVERCTACGSCARFCPTDALVIEENDDSFDLSFLPIECLDCGICAVACPEDAIAYGDRIESPMERSSLAAGPLVDCEACKTPTADRESDGRILCTWCRRGAGAVRPLHDEAGLFDDLLSRIDRMGDLQPPPNGTESDSS